MLSEAGPDFSRVIGMQREIDGSMLEESAAIWYQLLRAQHATWKWNGLTAGDYLEIGVLNGKSASVLANFSSAYGNSLTIIDPEIRPQTRKRLDGISPRLRYIESASETLIHSNFLADNRRSIAFAHIDGMHRFSAVISDLSLCEALLSNFGIISVDDFHTDLFPQIPAAVYKYLYSGPADLSIFLVGMNKAYLCRNIAKRYFMEFARNQLLPGLRALGYKLTLVKTDRNDAFDAFAISAFFEGDAFGNEHSPV
ncbi:MAG TPA: class I SAM-dependent methyltransferase [Rhizomicrobium sp.]|jgi:predicted O-methyltransferase YrrM